MLGNLAQGFSFLVLVRIGSRVIDFFLNILIFASTVHFQLITNVALFYTKNCLKTSYQKRSEKHKQQDIVKSSSNIMMMGVPITFVISAIMIILQMILNSDTVTLQYFALTALIYGVSAVFESFYEAMICKLVLQFNYKKIAKVQISSLVFKSLVLWIAVFFELLSNYGVLVFGISQLAYSIMLAFFGFLSNKSNKLVDKLSTNEYLIPQMKQSVKQFTIITFIKLILQQIQKIIMVIVNDVNILSIFTLVNNLGSIIPRFIFQPLQQIAYNVFAKSKNIAQLKGTLETLLRFQIVFGTILFIFGNLYSSSLLTLLYGQTWATSSTISALSSYCFYILWMGINGICEAFVYAKLQTQSLSKFRYYMMGATFIYVLTGIIVIYLGYGATGLFFSSSLGMIFRIFVCWKIYIQKIFTQSFFSWVRHLSVRKQVLILYALTAIGLSFINNKYNPLVNLLIGGVMAGINLLATAFLQKQTLIKIKQLTKRDQKQI